MRNYGDTTHRPVGPSSPQVGTIPALERPIGRSRERVIQVDHMSSSPRLQEIQKAGQMLVQTVEIRETRVVALRKDVESGHYSVKAEQVAEKIMQDHLLGLIDNRPDC